MKINKSNKYTLTPSKRKQSKARQAKSKGIGRVYWVKNQGRHGMESWIFFSTKCLKLMFIWSLEFKIFINWIIFTLIKWEYIFQVIFQKLVDQQQHQPN